MLAGPEVLGSIPRSLTGFWSGLENLCMHTACSLSSQSHYGLWLFGVIVIVIVIVCHVPCLLYNSACFVACIFCGWGGAGLLAVTLWPMVVRCNRNRNRNAQSMQRCVHHCGSGRMGRRQYGVLICCEQVVRNGPCHTAAWGEEKGGHMPHAPKTKGRVVMRGPRRGHARC